MNPMVHHTKNRVKLNPMLGKCAKKKKTRSPPCSIFATKRPQQQKRKQGRFEQPTTVRAPDIHASAEWATSKEIEAIVWHVVMFERRMLTRPYLRVKS